MPFFERDLEQIVDEDDSTLVELFGMNVVEEVLFQILCGILYLHNGSVVHRNICPSNILIGESNSIPNAAQICGFSNATDIDSLKNNPLACPYSPTNRAFQATELWTLSPDAIPSQQWKSMDMWSFGCIIAYILRGDPLFQIDRKTTSMAWLSQIYSVTECRPLDSPDIKDIEHRSLTEYVPIKSTDKIYDLLSKLLCFDSKSRLTAKEALLHPFFSTCISKFRVDESIATSCADEDITSFFKMVTNLY